MRCLSRSCILVLSGTEKLFPKKMTDTCLVLASGTICLLPKIRGQKLALLALRAGIRVLQSSKINRSLVVNNSNDHVHYTCHVVSYIFNHIHAAYVYILTHISKIWGLCSPLRLTAKCGVKTRKHCCVLTRVAIFRAIFRHSRPIGLPWIGER